MLGDAATRDLIRESFPRPEVTRRNTGYALDALMQASCFEPGTPGEFNMCRLLAGSEGTLFVGVEFELDLLPLPPPGALVVVHCHTVDEALRAAVVAMRHGPTGCELIDDTILECTKANLEQARNRDFVVGEPGAVLVVELRHDYRPTLEALLDRLEADVGESRNLAADEPARAGDLHARLVAWRNDVGAKLPRRNDGPRPAADGPQSRAARRGVTPGSSL